MQASSHDIIMCYVVQSSFFLLFLHRFGSQSCQYLCVILRYSFSNERRDEYVTRVTLPVQNILVVISEGRNWSYLVPRYLNGLVLHSSILKRVSKWNFHKKRQLKLEGECITHNIAVWWSEYNVFLWVNNRLPISMFWYEILHCISLLMAEYSIMQLPIQCLYLLMHTEIRRDFFLN